MTMITIEFVSMVWMTKLNNFIFKMIGGKTECFRTFILFYFWSEVLLSEKSLVPDFRLKIDLYPN